MNKGAFFENQPSMSLGAFRELMHSHALPATSVLEWTDEQKEIATRFYLVAQTRQRRSELRREAMDLTSFCPFIQQQLFIDEFKHNLYMLVEDDLIKLLELIK